MTPRWLPKGCGSELVESPWCAGHLHRRTAPLQPWGGRGEGWQQQEMLQQGVLPAGRWDGAVGSGAAGGGCGAGEGRRAALSGPRVLGWMLQWFLGRGGSQEELTLRFWWMSAVEEGSVNMLSAFI